MAIIPTHCKPLRSFIPLRYIQDDKLRCETHPTSYSKLEGQARGATDKEVYHISKALGVPMEALFPKEDTTI